ncbi:MAG: tetratricopeptide repeat protein [Opitutaceae bacterium]
MRTSLYSLIRLLSLFLLAVTSTQADSFQSGIKAYENGKYEAAIEAFTQAIAEGETAATRHNLALSYFQSGNPAEAAWQIERALRIDPLKSEYHYKIGALRQQMGLFENKPKWYSLGAQFLRPEAWIIIACSSFWLCLGAWMLPKLGGLNPSMGITAVRIIGMLALLIALPALWENHRLDQRGIVVSSEPTDLHAAPASAAPASGIARSGERARIIESYNDFYKVETEARIVGWISKDDFRSLAL